ncbi:Bug family tripartite tricarboxylate transporter substrate binding protein [Sabulicella glaciei]|uniref:Tripartite tricarboxylate transporter substrate binding protein n=1 Tax=Sabulicella glaciei TaxID=2984948 RepID=A0ABT3NXN3_9PROT|nr:tripartite tricarboxylate transporter substrate binding protein [Roseococcus sp. MDT2-1-1]MCW8086881.1 tripartite tricarboxylate transporter substrate binding protein [Roseococcus sp. MDT2-1-1]
MPHTKRDLLALAVATPALLEPGTLRAQTPSFPARPVRIVMPFAAGGPTDAIARAVAAQLETEWRQPVVVENRPGAGGSTGSAVVARAAPDGHTLLITANSHVINPAVLRNLPFDTQRDFTPVIRLADGPFVLVAHPSLGVRTLPEFVARVRERPGAFNYSSAGHGTNNHLAMERLKAMAGIDITHVAYGGAAPATTALLGGEVQAMINNLVNSLPHIAEGRMVAIAIGGLERSPVLPEVRSMSETYPGLTAVNWYAAFGPAGMPPELVATLNAAMSRAVRSPAVADRLRAQGITPAGGPAAEFARQVEEELATWGRVAREAGVRPE